MECLLDIVQDKKRRIERRNHRLIPIFHKRKQGVKSDANRINMME